MRQSTYYSTRCPSTTSYLNLLHSFVLHLRTHTHTHTHTHTDPDIQFWRIKQWMVNVSYSKLLSLRYCICLTSIQFSLVHFQLISAFLLHFIFVALSGRIPLSILRPRYSLFTLYCMLCLTNTKTSSISRSIDLPASRLIDFIFHLSN